MRVGLIGSGGWACALASLICQNKHTLLWWVRRPEVAAALRREGRHLEVFPEYVFPQQCVEFVTSDLKAVLREAELLILAIPARYVWSTLEKVDFPEGVPWVSGTKGLLFETGLRPSEYLSRRGVKDLAILSGPSYAEEVLACRPTWVGLGTASFHLCEVVKAILGTSFFHLLPTAAVESLEWVGILKNIYAIGIGAVSLLGENARAALAAAMLKELEAILSVWVPEERVEVLSPPWAGDFLVTAFGTLSRNQRLGQYLAQGYRPRTALARLGTEAEGYYAALALRSRIGPEFPFLYAITRVLNEEEFSENLSSHLLKLLS